MLKDTIKTWNIPANNLKIPRWPLKCFDGCLLVTWWEVWQFIIFFGKSLVIGFYQENKFKFWPVRTDLGVCIVGFEIPFSSWTGIIVVFLLNLNSNSSTLNNKHHERDRVIWKSDVRFWGLFIPLFSWYLMVGLRSYIKHSKECFIRYPNTFWIWMKGKNLQRSELKQARTSIYLQLQTTLSWQQGRFSVNNYKDPKLGILPGCVI